MQITPEELLAEASRMALELRLKDRLIEQLTTENRDLVARLDSPDVDPGG